MLLKMKKQNEDKLLGEIITINSKERGIARCRFKPFCTYIWWILKLNQEGTNQGIFVPKDLCRYAKINYNIAYRLFEDLVNLDYFTKTEYHYELKRNDGEIKLMELLPYIKKTLNIK